MTIPQINQAIQQTGSAGEAAAANAAMIVTGLEKDINKTALTEILKESNLKTNQTDNRIKSVSSACQVNKIKKFENRKEEEQEEGEKEPLPKKQPFAYRGKKTTNGRLILKIGEIDPIINKRELNLDLLKQYSVLYGKVILEIPPQKEHEHALLETERKLNLPYKTLERLKQRIEKIIFVELAHQLKSAIDKKINSPIKILDFILKNKKALEHLNFILFNEMLSAPPNTQNQSFIDKQLQEALKGSTELNIPDLKGLRALAKELGLTNDFSFLDYFYKMHAGKNGEIIIDDSILEQEKIKSLLFDEFKLLEVEYLLSEKLRKKALIFFRRRRVLSSLYEIGVNSEEIKKAKTVARRIAWAKSVAKLKDLHLKRIFTSSMHEFEKYAKIIKRQTLKTRRLGFDIHQKGLQWIEAQIETLALESAVYKLELLKSMQKLEFNKNREHDIKHLSSTVEHYKTQIKTYTIPQKESENSQNLVYLGNYSNPL